MASLIEGARGGLGGFKGEGCQIEDAALCAESLHFCAWMPVG